MKIALSRRSLLQSAAFTLATTRTNALPAATKTQPNILLITMDELRPDVFSCLGNKYISTPNIDALAKRGTFFTRTYCQGPLCQPARASLITGEYVKQTGQSWNRKDMNPEWPTMMKALQGAGYFTAMVGKTHFAGSWGPARIAPDRIDLRSMTPWSKKFGLDYLLEEFDHFLHKVPHVITPYTEYLKSKGLLEAYLEEVPDFFHMRTPEQREALWTGRASKLSEEDQLSSFVGNEAIDWIRNYKGDKPFFLWVSFIEPHPPLTVATRWFEKYRHADIPTGTRKLPEMPDNAWGRYLHEWTTTTNSALMTDADALQMARAYYGLVAQVDAKIGDVVRTLDESGYGKNTWIVFSADHGEMLAHHNLVYKNVFFRGAVEVPNIIVPPGGMRSKRVNDLVQSIDITQTIVDMGRAKLPTSKGQSLVPLIGGSGRSREVVHSELAGLMGKSDYFVMAATSRYRYTYDRLNKLSCELYDLQIDPGEMHNLIEEPRYRGIAQDMFKDYVQPFMT